MSLRGPSTDRVDGSGDDARGVRLCFSDSTDKVEEEVCNALVGTEVCVFLVVFLLSAVFGFVELELLCFNSRMPSAPLYLYVAGSELFAESPAMLAFVYLLDPGYAYVGALVGALPGVDSLRGEAGPLTDEDVLVAEVLLMPPLAVECLPTAFWSCSLPLSALPVGNVEMLSSSLEEAEGGRTEPMMSLTSISIAELRPAVGDDSGGGTFSTLLEEDSLVDSTEGKNAPSTTRGDAEAETPILLFRPPGVCKEETELALCGERESSACLAVSLWEGITMLVGLEDLLDCSEVLGFLSLSLVGSLPW